MPQRNWTEAGRMKRGKNFIQLLTTSIGDLLEIKKRLRCRSLVYFLQSRISTLESIATSD